MQKLIDKTLAYRLGLLIGLFFTINSLAITITAAFLHTDWSSLTNTEKFVLIWVIIGGFSNTMLAFLNKTLARIEQGEFPLETGETNHITKTDIIK